MNKFMMIAATGVTSVVFAASVVSPVYAWHPEGKITKSVQNVTAGGAYQAADKADNAVVAAPGDILNYYIEVKNVAKPAQKQYNDMDFTIVKDQLPAGVELVENAANREVVKDLGLILPGESKNVAVQVKVTASVDGEIIKNTACFTADSVVKDNKQQGCDDAFVRVEVPEVPVVTPPATETPGKGGDNTPAPAPEVLPEVGAGSVAALAALVGSFGYAASALRFKRRIA